VVGLLPQDPRRVHVRVWRPARQPVSHPKKQRPFLGDPGQETGVTKWFLSTPYRGGFASLRPAALGSDAVDFLGGFAEDAVEDFVSQVDGLVDGVAGGDDANVDLALAGEADAGDETGSEVDHSTVDAGQVGVRVEHHRGLRF